MKRNSKVEARISELRRAAAEIAVVDEARVLAEAAHVAMFDWASIFDETGALLPIRDMPAAARAAISSFKVDRKGGTVQVKLWDKNAALEKLMKHSGAYRSENAQKTSIFDNVPLSEMVLIEAMIREHLDAIDGGPAGEKHNQFEH